MIRYEVALKSIVFKKSFRNFFIFTMQPGRFFLVLIYSRDDRLKKPQIFSFFIIVFLKNAKNAFRITPKKSK